MTHERQAWAKIVLVLLTLLEALSVYQVLFCAWMTAFAPATADEWRRRFYVRLATSIVVGLLWIGLLIWLTQHRRKAEPAAWSDPKGAKPKGSYFTINLDGVSGTFGSRLEWEWRENPIKTSQFPTRIGARL